MIRTEVREENILWITFDDPESRNAMDEKTMQQLANTWRRFATDDSLRVAVITGAGEKSFCAGANLKKLVPKIQAGELKAADNQEAYMKGDIDPVDKPIIAAINGDCLGGGFEVMLSTDIRITANHARFGLPEVNWGLFPGGGGTVRLPRQVPRAIAMEIMMSGEFFTADRAYEIGLVNKVVPAAELEEIALAKARRIARNGPIAVQRVKESVREGIDLPIADAFNRELDLADQVFANDEAAEGLKAFADKRLPNY